MNVLLAALAWCGGVTCIGLGLSIFRKNLLATLILSSVTLGFGVATLYLIASV